MSSLLTRVFLELLRTKEPREIPRNHHTTHPKAGTGLCPALGAWGGVVGFRNQVGAYSGRAVMLASRSSRVVPSTSACVWTWTATALSTALLLRHRQLRRASSSSAVPTPEQARRDKVLDRTRAADRLLTQCAASPLRVFSAWLSSPVRLAWASRTWPSGCAASWAAK